MSNDTRLPFNTKVYVTTPEYVEGVIVGVADTGITQTHVILCTDGTFPNDTYQYNTFVIPRCLIKVLGEDTNE